MTTPITDEAIQRFREWLRKNDLDVVSNDSVITLLASVNETHEPTPEMCQRGIEAWLAASPIDPLPDQAATIYRAMEQERVNPKPKED